MSSNPLVEFRGLTAVQGQLLERLEHINKADHQSVVSAMQRQELFYKLRGIWGCLAAAQVRVTEYIPSTALKAEWQRQREALDSIRQQQKDLDAVACKAERELLLLEAKLGG
jgi:hypothetical protein